MLRKKFICFSLLVLIITIGAVSASQNITSENNLQADNTTENTFENIQNTIEKAEINSTIILNGTYEGSGSEIVIDKDITIDGLGNTTLDANHQSRIFNITSNNVILKNINFINAKSPTNGGAITSSGQLTVINCNFINNTVNNGHEYHYLLDEFGYALEYTGQGGAINANNDLIVFNSSFINNSAHIRAYYRSMDWTDHLDEGEGGAINCLGNLNIEKSNFSKNFHKSIRACNSNIQNCNFENQEGIFVAVRDCNVSFTNSSFNNCSGIKSYYTNINLNMNQCNFTNGKNNLIDIYDMGNVIINNSIFENNKFSLYDTSLIEITGTTKLINSTFINNSVSNTAILKLDSYNLKNCTFINNHDATILSNNKMLNDSLSKFYLFEAKVRNNLAKTYYGSKKSVMVDILNKLSKKRSDELWGIKVYINGKRKTYFDDNPMYDLYEDSLKFLVSTWKVGTYTVVVKPDNSYTQPTTFKITVKKAPTIVKAPKVTNKYKKSSYFKVKVTHKITKKAVKNTYIKLKIDKKTYKIKTNSKGIAKFNTNKLKFGTHKVAISSGNANYKISAKSQIKIK